MKLIYSVYTLPPSGYKGCLLKDEGFIRDWISEWETSDTAKEDESGKIPKHVVAVMDDDDKLLCL